MIYVLTPEQMRHADATASDAVGATELMAVAGARIADVVRSDLRNGRVVAFAGPGNNGGDAFAALASLRERDSALECIAYVSESGEESAARQVARRRARTAGALERPFPSSETHAREACAGAAVVLDGLFGTGARTPLEEPYAGAVRGMNAGGAPIVAIDIPSGIDAETGAAPGAAVMAHITVTLAAVKPGLLLDPARACSETLYCAEIGIDDATLDRFARGFAMLDDAKFVELLPQRKPTDDKRSAGAPLIVAGSRQFPGAAVLCAFAAARTGAGYVTIATPASAAPALRMHLIEQVVIELDESADARKCIEALLDTARHASAIGIGPGLGLDERTGEIVRGFLQKSELPFVADAGALFHFAKHLDVIRTTRGVITPHAGEFARLSGEGTVRDGDRVRRLRSFVERSRCTTLLKGRTTLIDDGTTLHLNPTGTPALATAGTGDVLTGIIATLLSQGLTPVDAARAGAYWHGLAARTCASQRSRGVIARDVADALGSSLPKLERTRPPIVRVY